MMTPIRGPRASGKSGYALLAALLILLMVTLLGILAMVSSTSEQRVVNNLSEDKLMFYYGEQGVYRILNHMHYLSQGLFGATNGANFTDTLTREVVDDNGALYLFGSGATASQNANFRLSAWVNPKDFGGPYDRGPSRPAMISVAVQNTQTGYTKAFRAKAVPKSIWDLAYYAKNSAPAARTAFTSVESCGGDASSWYACQSVFHNEDAVTGDIYLRNAAYALTNGYDNSTIFVRGTPSFQGKLAWAGLAPFDYGAAGISKNQTLGGINGSDALNTVYGMSSYANEIDMFPITMLTQGTGTQSFRAQADIVLKKRTNRVWKIVFRNDLDVDQDGIYEADSRVASRYDYAVGVNDGARNSNDPGLFHVYSVPYTTEQQVRAAHWGDSMRRRHLTMITGTVGGEIWEPSVTWNNDITGPGKCYTVHHNTPTLFNMKPTYDEEDIENDAYLFFTPVGGVDRSSYALDGSGSCSGTSSGIIFVDGDVLVSGIVDGFVTIAATGNIILDHEVQYEQHPGDRSAQTFLSASDMDMLGLFATGNIIIPNSYPDTLPNPNSFTLPDKEPLRYVYSDDWSDADTEVGTTLAGRGHFDHPEPGFADDGNEEIHAVMVSFGRTTTAIDGSGNATVIDPTDSMIRNFEVGVYAQARTSDGIWYSNNFYDASGTGWSSLGNDSGKLTIWGAVIQEWPGRLSYDHPTSSCTNGVGANCRHMGHDMVLYHDNRLDVTLPAHPALNTSGGAIPYGMASWDIAEWETIDASEISDENVNGQPW